MELIIVKDNIADVSADVIVLPANEKLKIGSGASKAIFEKAGRKELEAACKKIEKPVKTGCAYPTLAYGLNAKYIMHAVVPKWRGGTSGEYEKLCSVYQSILELSDEMECSTIAMPLLCAGHNGFDVELAFEIAKTSVEAYETNNKLKCVILVLFVDEAVIVARKAGYYVQKNKSDSYFMNIDTNYRSVPQEILERGLEIASDWLSDPDNVEKIVKIGKKSIRLRKKVL